MKTRRLSLLGSCLTAVAIQMAIPPLATAHPHGGVNQIPRGSYRESCDNIYVNGDDLYAQCRTINGRRRNTGLRNFDSCRGEIINDDGYLRCSNRRNDRRDRRGDRRRGSYNIPQGSYQDSCYNIYVNGNDLYAQCSTTNGRRRNTELRNFDSCRGEIINNNGYLECETRRDRRRRRRRESYNIPQGSYQDSCYNIYVNGNDLYAQCSTTNGRRRNTELRNFDSCSGEIINNNGYLECETRRDRRRRSDNIPRGSYRDSCDNININGNDLYAQCGTTNGRRRNTVLRNFNRCVGDIANLDGQLSCQRRR